MMWKTAKVFLHISYIFILFILFFTGFGITSINKYMKDESIEIVSKEFLTEPILAPSVTICPTNPLRANGLKIKEPCGSKTNDDLLACIMRNTYTLTEALVGIGLPNQKMKNGETFHYQEITRANLSRHFSSRMFTYNCHTIRSGIEIRTYGKIKKGPLRVLLNDSLDYWIYVSDPKYSILSVDLGALSGFRFRLRHSTNNRIFYNMKMTKHIKRSTVQQPCNADADYSYTECVQDAVDRRVGCSPPWAVRGKQSLCSRMHQFTQQRRNYYQIEQEGIHAKVMKVSGCIVPCQYQDFKLTEEFHHSFVAERNSTEMILSLDSADILVKEA